MALFFNGIRYAELIIYYTGVGMNMTDTSETLTTRSKFYQEGIDAYWEGIAYERNPYLANSIEYQRWADGWVSAESADSLDF